MDELVRDAKRPLEELTTQQKERFKDLQATASAQPGDDPKIAALKTNAQKAIEAGQLAEADALLAEIEMEQNRWKQKRITAATDEIAQARETGRQRARDPLPFDLAGIWENRRCRSLLS